MPDTTRSKLPSQPIRLHHFALSGHSHRVLLMLTLLGLPVELVPVDLPRGGHKTPEFLAMNPFGQIPVIQDDGVTLSDSNAILVYLAQRYDPTGQWLPQAPLQMAEVQRWLSAAAGPLAFGPAHARAGHVFKRPVEPRAYELANKLLTVMESVLAQHQYLVDAAQPTIADVAMYSYTAHAPEGGISLTPYVNVRRWIADIQAWPGFVPLPASACPDAVSRS
jgi:glutathione S-transferase